MDFKLSDELQMLKDTVRDFVDEKVAPFADDWEENHHFPYKEAIKPMGDLGFLALLFRKSMVEVIWVGWRPLF